MDTSSTPSLQPPSPRRLLNRDFLLLWQGQLVSQFGNQAFFVAMMFWTMQATGSAAVMGLLLMVSALPGALLSPVGGVLADRHSRRFLIILADTVRGLGVLGLAGLMYWRPGDTDLLLTALFAVSIVSGIMGALFQPAITAAIPDLVPRTRVMAANSLNRLSVQVTTFVGQATGGVLFQLFGAPLLFLADGLTYLFSAASESFISIPQEFAEETRGLGASFSSYLHDIREGFLYVWARKGMRDFLLTAASVNFFLTSVTVLLPFYVETFLGEGADWYGFLLAAFGAGSVGGYLIAGAPWFIRRVRGVALTAFLFGAAATILLTGLTSQRLVALGLLFAMGVFIGAINISLLTLLQLTTPGKMRGRVMGLAISMTSAAIPLGMVFAGAVGDLTGKNVPLIFAVASAAVAALTLLAALRRPFREFLSQEIPSAAEIELAGGRLS